MGAILCVRITGLLCRAAPRSYGPATMVHGRFQEELGAELFEPADVEFLRYDAGLDRRTVKGRGGLLRIPPTG